MKIGFIGAGNMANAIIRGLIGSGINCEQIMASNRSPEKLHKLRDSTGINIGDNDDVVAFADLVVLAVKPQLMAEVVSSIREPLVLKRPLIVTIAAGIDCSAYQSWLDKEINIVRAMPNTPTLVSQGITGLYTENLDDKLRAAVGNLFAPLGLIHWLESESGIDDIIAIAGSSPAYFFYFLEAMQKKAIEYGFSADDARTLVAQAGFGAMSLANSSDLDFATLKTNVMSKGGTTEQAILSFEQNHLETLVSDAMDACKTRAKEMAKQIN